MSLVVQVQVQGFETLLSEALCVMSLENFGPLIFIRSQNQLSITELADE